MDNNFTEATLLAISPLCVAHDIRGLSNLLGGRDSLAKSLDALFEADTAILGKTPAGCNRTSGTVCPRKRTKSRYGILICLFVRTLENQCFNKKILACFLSEYPQRFVRE